MLPEIGYELSVSVRDDINRAAVQTEDVLREQSGNFLGTICGVVGNVMSELRQAVDDDKDSIVPLTLWQVRNKVHRDVIPGAVGGR